MDFGRKKKNNKSKEVNWIGHTFSKKFPLKQGTEGKIEKRSRITRGRGKKRKQLMDGLRKRKGRGNCKRKHLIALSEELALAEPMRLSQNTPGRKRIGQPPV